MQVNRIGTSAIFNRETGNIILRIHMLVAHETQQL